MHQGIVRAAQTRLNGRNKMYYKSRFSLLLTGFVLACAPTHELAIIESDHGTLSCAELSQNIADTSAALSKHLAAVEKNRQSRSSVGSLGAAAAGGLLYGAAAEQWAKHVEELSEAGIRMIKAARAKECTI